MDTALVVILSGVSLFLLLLAVAIITGRGDGLIAGYNTAKEEKRNQFNLKRLRAMVATLIMITVAFIWLVPLLGDSAILWMLLILFCLYVICAILANTWCKKK